HGQGCAAHIVHRHRSQVGGGGGVVQQYRFDVPLPQLQQRIQTALGGGRDHPAHTVLGEQPQASCCAFGILVRTAQHQRVVVLRETVLDSAGHLGEERVGDVEHHHAHRGDLPAAQLPGGGIPDEVQLPDRRFDLGAGPFRDTVRTVEDV